MLNNDLDLRDAADLVHHRLKRYMDEPTPENEEVFLTTLRHYILRGFQIKLLSEGAVAISREVGHA